MGEDCGSPRNPDHRKDCRSATDPDCRKDCSVSAGCSDSAGRSCHHHHCTNNLRSSCADLRSSCPDLCGSCPDLCRSCPDLRHHHPRCCTSCYLRCTSRHLWSTNGWWLWWFGRHQHYRCPYNLVKDLRSI